MSLFGKKKFKGKERRKYIRLNSHHLLKYKVADKGGRSFVRNISAGGVLFVSKENIPIGTVVELEINFPGFPRPIKADVKVVRNRELKKLGYFENGAEFINVDEDAKEFINTKILAVSKGLGK